VPGKWNSQPPPPPVACSLGCLGNVSMVLDPAPMSPAHYPSHPIPCHPIPTHPSIQPTHPKFSLLSKLTGCHWRHPAEMRRVALPCSRRTTEALNHPATEPPTHWTEHLPPHTTHIPTTLWTSHTYRMEQDTRRWARELTQRPEALDKNTAKKQLHSLELP